MSTRTTTTATTGNRCVPSQHLPSPHPLPFDTSPSQLLLDLYRAWKDARRHKRQKGYQLAFEQNAEKELISLRDEILTGRYRPGPSKCFIIHDPKMREVFAAGFRDRVVHHLLYNYIASLLVPGFVDDSYSCIPGRGTHYGILRLEEKIRTVSRHYSSPCYVLKLDIEGYFMHINRRRLLDICLDSLEEYRFRTDYPLVEYLLKVIVLDDPTQSCQRIGALSDWEGLPPGKSLFHSPPGCGLPIGNLTSQLFSNVYLNVFDQFMVSLLGEGRYGRYVDDAYVVGANPAELRRLIPIAGDFLRERLDLNLSRKKVSVYSAYRGVEFLGAYLKPFRRYISSRTLERMDRKVYLASLLPGRRKAFSINSFLGITSHYRAYRIRLRWLSGPLRKTLKEGYYRRSILKYCPRFRPGNTPL